MSTSVATWTQIATNPAVFCREYSFGSGTANTLAVELPERKLLLVSPPVNLPPTELEALSAHGEVIAMVAINGAHHLGLEPCRKVFPRAVTYATPDARKRILKRGKNAGQLEPIECLQPLLGGKVSVLAAPGCKLGDVVIRVESEAGALLYAGDFIANIQSLPSNLLFRLMFKLTSSGPGLKVFQIFFKFFVTDKVALREFLIRELEGHPPAVLVPGHGDVVTREQLGPTLVSMLRAAF